MCGAKSLSRVANRAVGGLGGLPTPVPMVALRPPPPPVIQSDMYHLWASVMPRMIADVGTRIQSLDAQYG
jgi:hypothetical protein